MNCIMKNIEFNGFIINYHDSINAYINDDDKKIIFINENDDEIHGVLELDESNKVKIYPRWNVSFIIEDKKVIVGVNYEGD